MVADGRRRSSIFEKQALGTRFVALSSAFDHTSAKSLKILAWENRIYCLIYKYSISSGVRSLKTSSETIHRLEADRFSTEDDK